MAANTANVSPIFVNAGNITTARIAAANTASDGSGALVTMTTATTDGTRIDGFRIRNSQATAATSSAMVVRAFLSDTNGANFRLVAEVALGAATRNASTIGATAIYTFDQPVIMRSGQIISVCQSVYAGVQDQNDVCPFAGNY